MLSEAHVLQHHDGAQEKSSRVGKALASNVRSRAVDSLKDRALIANIARRREAETTDQASAHIRQNITIKVGHDKNLVIVGSRIGDDLEARVVQQLRIKLDIRELFGDLASGVQEETIGHLHNGGLVHNTDLLLVDGLSVLEGEPEHPLRRLLGDELDTLNHAIYHNMLNARVFALGIFTDQDSVDIVVRGLVASDGPARANIGEEVESATKCKVKGNMALSNRSLHIFLSIAVPDRQTADTYGKRTLEGNIVATNALDSVVGDCGLSILQGRGDVDRFPLNRGLLPI